jgi:DNA-binding response OmpR family regulator
LYGSAFAVRQRGASAQFAPVRVENEIFEQEPHVASRAARLPEGASMSLAHFRAREKSRRSQGQIKAVSKRSVLQASMLLPVEPQVFDLLVFLVGNHDRVVSNDDLLAAVWRGRIVSESTSLGPARA